MDIIMLAGVTVDISEGADEGANAIPYIESLDELKMGFKLK